MHERCPRRMKKRDIISSALQSIRAGFASVIVFSLFINLLAFVGPLYMLQIYDRVITSRSVDTLLIISAIAIFLLIVFAVLERCRSAVLTRLGILFDETAREGLFSRAARATTFVPSIRPAQALRDLDTMRGFLTGTGLVAFCDAPWVPIFVVGCYLLHPYFGAVAAAGALVIFGLALANELMTRGPLNQSSQDSAAADAWAAATFRNSEVLRAMGMATALRARWLTQHDAVLRNQKAADDRGGAVMAASKFFRASLQIAILGLGAYLVIQQEVSPGSMIAASILMGRALAPVEMAVSNWKGFLAARAARGRLTTLLAGIPDEEPRMQLPEPRGALAVQNLFAAPPGERRPTIRSITFDIAAGETVGVIGPSGSGKSTLMRAVLGIWPALGGTVRLDGSDLQHWSPDQLGRHIGYLPQDIELFGGTVAENIARFSNAEDSKIIEAAQLAGVHEVIQKLPEGYGTRLSGDGGGLSGGQRQRIGLARAFFGVPKLVVLDEPNSNLDHEGEQALIAGIRRMQERGSTILLVTHKPSLVGVTHKMILLVNGEIDAFGPRDEVMTKVMGSRPAQQVEAKPQSGNEPPTIRVRMG